MVKNQFRIRNSNLSGRSENTRTPSAADARNPTAGPVVNRFIRRVFGPPSLSRLRVRSGSARPPVRPSPLPELGLIFNIRHPRIVTVPGDAAVHTLLSWP